MTLVEACIWALMQMMLLAAWIVAMAMTPYQQRERIVLTIGFVASSVLLLQVWR